VVAWGKLAPGACLRRCSFFRACESDNRIPPGNRRAISAQEFEYPSTGGSVDPVEVGGMHHISSLDLSFPESIHCSLIPGNMLYLCVPPPLLVVSSMSQPPFLVSPQSKLKIYLRWPSYILCLKCATILHSVLHDTFMSFDKHFVFSLSPSHQFYKYDQSRII
jgi:hypothetical protein